MTAQEFREWQLYARIEPFGSAHEDYRFGKLMAIMVNMQRKRGSKALQPWDFMPPFEKRTKKYQTWQEQLQVVEALNQAFGGKDLRTTKEPIA